MQHLDRQLATFRSRLCQDVGLTIDESAKVATLVAADVRFLPVSVKDRIAQASPVPLTKRLEELKAFQSWMDYASSVRRAPAVTRAQVIVQNYVCLVYLKDACFEIVAENAANGSVAARCAKYLSTGKVRDLRNAFSHANWCYNTDFSSLDCWVLIDWRKPQLGMRYFPVSQGDLDFWQALSRGVAYAIYLQLSG